MNKQTFIPHRWFLISVVETLQHRQCCRKVFWQRRIKKFLDNFSIVDKKILRVFRITYKP